MVERISPNPLTETANTESVGQFLLRIRQTALWSNLDENEQLVLESRHLEDLTLEKTAPQIGVSTKERVRQIEVNAWGIILHLLPDELRAQILAQLPPQYSNILQFDSQTAILKAQGFTINQIAEKLGRTRTDIQYSTHRLIAAGRIERCPKGRLVGQTTTTIERDKRVARLRKAGLTNPRIAKKLGVSLQTVAHSAMRLIAAGRIERAPGGVGRPVGQTTAIIERDTKIAQLRKEGKSNAEIAQELSVSLRTVRYSAGRLIATGRIARAR